jgi:glycosyltransferase involved in cell wall biosynthesis
LTVPSTEPGDHRDFVRDAVPPALRTISCRKPLRGVRHWCTQQSYLRQLRSGGVAYIWPGASPWVYEQVKAHGRTLIMERINCHQASARRILDDAYDRLGLPAAHGITDVNTAREQYKLEMADLVFCPSPLVRKSLLEAGIPADKLLSVSYGWDPRRFSGTHRALERVDGITLVFVGLACVRKGVHLLLRAWERAKVAGRLVIVGDVAADIAGKCADQLNRSDVLHLPYHKDVAAVFRSADVFAFPTLEEGSPLVSYEAMASGLASIISPMGAGEVVRDGREGIVLDPYAEDAWVEAIQRLARDDELRENLGRRARQRAQDYTWQQVGRRRRMLLSEILRAESPVIAGSLVAD